MRLMVCPRTEVPHYQDAPVTHFVSLVDPGDDPELLPVPPTTESRLILAFSDLDDIEVTLPRFARYTPPKEKDVARLVSYGRGLAERDAWGLLAHCEAGISRSTAAAITMLTAAGYPPETAFQIVQSVCPEMLPNRRMLRMADSLLGTGNTLRSMAEIHRRKAFEAAGYEDPTNVLLREAEADKQKSFVQRLLSALPNGWRSLVGSGARARAAIQHKNSVAAAARHR